MNDDASGEQQRRIKKDMEKKKQKFDTVALVENLV